MYGKDRKRKQREHQSHSNLQPGSWSHGSNEPDPALFVQAHEADVVRGPRAWSAASTLNFKNAGSADGKNGGLIRWNVPGTPRGDDGSEDTDEGIIWVDRYDARLLLDALPSLRDSKEIQRTTESFSDGWSDLPSDTEDTFFFSRDEAADYHREKRRRVIDQGREERLKALRDTQGEEEENREEDEWGGSDEEPDDAQKGLMQRTAAHLVTSPNAAQLEMRILANHGADKRFAFLRGRWGRAWRLAKGHARLDLEHERQEKAKASQQAQTTVLGGLAGYGDSDSGSEEEEAEPPSNTRDMKEAIPNQAGEKVGEESVAAETPLSAGSPAPLEDDAKAARRARAREWAAKRRTGIVNADEAKPES